MTNELGREMTIVEHIAVATGEMSIMDILHGVALEMDAERGAEVVQVCADGFEITRAMVEQEIRETKSAWRGAPISSGRGPLVVGLNASSNMFA